MADVAHSLAEEVNTQGTWDRRSQEWKHQVDVIMLEIQQIKRQSLAAERRRDVALRELNNHQRQMEHAAEVQDFLRNRFTKQELYLFLQQETATLYRQAYNLATKTAREAQQAFWYERGDSRRNFLQEVMWNSLHEGLMAGERLDMALHTMDHAYMELNCREYELTKQLSLRLQFPLAFLQLKTCGYCEIEIPEWMFDLDYPSHYMRRIRNISLSVPCVAGPYTGVHCRAQLLSSSIRYAPLLPGPEACCCDKKLKQHCDHDPYLIKRYSGTEAIATSEALDDDGLFELNFRDERYLPFEFCGAVSKWRIELPPENNMFDFGSLTDFVMRLNYTAREGGPDLGRMKSGLARERVPGNGLRYFDVRHEFQDAWKVFAGSSSTDRNWDREHGYRRGRGQRDQSRGKRERSNERHRDFDLRFTRNMFPFLTCHHAITLKRVHLFMDVDRDEHCNTHICVEYIPARKRQCCDDDDGRKKMICQLDSPSCSSSDSKSDDCGDDREGWARDCCQEEKENCCCSNIFHGIVDVEIGPLGMRSEGAVCKLRLPIWLQGVKEAWLVCEYAAEKRR